VVALPGAGAELVGRTYNRLRLDLRMSSEREEKALVRHEMLHHSREKTGLGSGLPDLAQVKSRQRGETLQLILVAGKESESLNGDGCGRGGRGYRAT
jgi:hypothetical protein